MLSPFGWIWKSSVGGGGEQLMFSKSLILRSLYKGGGGQVYTVLRVIQQMGNSHFPPWG